MGVGTVPNDVKIKTLCNSLESTIKISSKLKAISNNCYSISSCIVVRTIVALGNVIPLNKTPKS
jgi:hypothetical protein